MVTHVLVSPVAWPFWFVCCYLIGMVLRAAYDSVPEQPAAYKRLGVRPGMSLESVKNAYLEKLMKHWGSAMSLEAWLGEINLSRNAFKKVICDLKKQNGRN